ncbi:MAG: hypothetical protein MUO35_05585 [Anaerolineales bacterium]|nr:hypothetical protein [Anaerolineales bacterium]
MQYPRSINRHGTRLVLTALIRFGFASFRPARPVAGRAVGFLAWMGPVVAAAFAAVGFRAW